MGDLAPIGQADTIERSISDQTERRIHLIERETEQAHICIWMPALSYTTPRRFVQGTIEAILSSGMSSRLFQEIREKRGLVYSVYGYFRPYEDVGQGVIYAGTDLDRVDEAITAIVGELRKLRDDGVSEEELRMTKELRKGRLLMGLEDSRSVASWVGSQELTYGDDQNARGSDVRYRSGYRRRGPGTRRGALPVREIEPRADRAIH